MLSRIHSSYQMSWEISPPGNVYTELVLFSLKEDLNHLCWEVFNYMFNLFNRIGLLDTLILLTSLLVKISLSRHLYTLSFQIYHITIYSYLSNASGAGHLNPNISY